MADVRIRWSLDVVDRGAEKLLRQDRALRTSIGQTDKAYDKLGRSSTTVSARQVAASRRAAGALGGLERAEDKARRGADRLNGAQSHGLSIGQRVVAQSDAIAAAYDRRGRAAERAANRERSSMAKAASATQKGLGAGVGAAGAVGGVAARAAGVAGAAGILATAAATSKAIGLGNQYNRTIDAQNVAFTTLLKSQDRARTFMGQLQALALKSPVLDVQSTGQAAQTMLAYGLSLKQVLPMVEAVGNMSAASGKAIGDVMPQAALAIGQVASKGKLQTEELNQLAESVGLSRGRIRKALGMTRADFEKSFTPGNAISASKAIPAILKAMQDQSAGAAERLAKTTAGKLDRAREVIGKAAGQLTRPIYDAVGDLAGGLADRLQKVDFSHAGKVIGDKLHDAAQTGIRGARAAVSTATGFVAGISGRGGGTGGGPRGTAATVGAGLRAGAQGKSDSETAGFTGAGGVAVQVGNAARSVVTAVKPIGRMIVDAFKPAMPFLQNVLLPLFIGVAKGIGAGFVVALKVIGVFAKGLGAVGRAAKPFRGIIEGIGQIIGLVFGGPILEFLGGIGKIGIAFKLLSAPIRVVTGLFGRIGGAIKGLPGFLTRIGGAVGGAGKALIRFAEQAGTGVVSRLLGFGGRVLSAAGRLASRAGTGLSKMPGAMARWAVRAGDSIVDKIVSVGGRLARAGAGLISKLANGVRGKLGDLTSFFGRVGKSILTAIGNAIRGAGSLIVDALKAILPGGKVGKAITNLLFRGGGVAFAAGGVVPSRVSPGEMLVYPDGRTSIVPGAPTAADSVGRSLPAGTAVLTGHGQALVGAGASLSEALAYQQPHFGKGGVVPGKYVSTAYGPPWGGIQGTGVTATGVNLRRNPHLYGIAVDPRMIPLGAQVYANPNPFGRSGPFRAFDTGGAIKGRRVDFYDWRGRRKQNGWGRRTVTISTAKIRGVGSHAGSGGGGATSSTADTATERVPISVGGSAVRAGLLGDEQFTTALEAARAGTSPTRALFLSQLGAALRGVTTTREVTVPGAATSSSSTTSAGGKAGGKLPSGVYTPGTTWNPLRKPIARWIGPYLTYGASHGWHGIVKSGFRSKAEQTRIWNSGVRPAARPGTSNHEGSAYPRGAVDVTAAGQLSAVLSRKPGPHLLRWAGAKDPVHFSHPHGGSYRAGGVVPPPTAANRRADKAELRWLQRMWARVAPLYGMPATSSLTGLFKHVRFSPASPFVGVASDPDAKDHATDELLWPRWLWRSSRGQKALDPKTKQKLFIHEMAHRFQVRKQTPTTTLSEGGAEAFARRVMVDRFGGYPADPADPYNRYVRQVRRAKSASWIMRGQFGFQGGGVVGLAGAAGAAVGRAIPRTAGLPGALAAVRTSRAGSLAAFVAAAEHAATTVLENLRKQLLAQVRKGGDAKTIARIQAAISAIDNTLGARVGRILRRVDQEKAKAERGQGQLDRNLRRAGTDPESAAGIQANIDFAATQVIPGAQRNVMRLADAAIRARNAGHPEQARAIQDELTQAQDDLDEATVSQIERQRNLLAAATQQMRDNAQAGVDTAQFGLDVTQNAMAGLDVTQRLNRTADTPAGMIAKAQATQTTLATAIQVQIAALQEQLRVANATGDVAGARSATLAIQSAGNDLATAMADAADLIRQAATQAAQDVVDAATHRESMVNLAQAHLELEQRIAGTYDAGGQARADFINRQLIPAIQAEIAALAGQQATAAAQGDTKLADQIAEAIAGKQNDILQATLDATEQVAANTEQRRVGGTLGFTYGNENTTDAIIAAGNGS